MDKNILGSKVFEVGETVAPGKQIYLRFRFSPVTQVFQMSITQRRSPDTFVLRRITVDIKRWT